MKKFNFSNEELIERIKMFEKAGLMNEIEITKDYVSAFVHREGEEFQFNLLENINYNNIFNFGTTKVDKESFYERLKNIDQSLFLIVKKIHFVSNEEEFEILLEKYEEDHYFDLDDYVGMFLSSEFELVINTKLIKEESKDEKEFNIGIWTTLLHELRHTQFDSLVIWESELPSKEDNEEDVESYAIEVFENDVEPFDYCCFKIK